VNNLSWKWAVVAVAVAASIAGCGDGGPRLYKAGGTVTYKNAPVEGATVTFTYDDGNFANGVTGADGKFQLNYMGKPGGAALGKCKVGISKTAEIKTGITMSNTPGKKTPEDYQKDMKAMQDGMKKYAEEKAKADAAGGPASLIPKKYGDANSSGLAYEIVTDESKNNFEIKLAD